MNHADLRYWLSKFPQYSRLSTLEFSPTYIHNFNLRRMAVHAIPFMYCSYFGSESLIYFSGSATHNTPPWMEAPLIRSVNKMKHLSKAPTYNVHRHTTLSFMIPWREWSIATRTFLVRSTGFSSFVFSVKPMKHRHNYIIYNVQQFIMIAFVIAMFLNVNFTFEHKPLIAVSGYSERIGNKRLLILLCMYFIILNQRPGCWLGNIISIYIYF